MKVLKWVGIAVLLLSVIPFVLQLSFVTRTKTTEGIIGEILSRKNGGTSYVSDQAGSVYPCKLSIYFRVENRQVNFQTSGEREPCNPTLSFTGYYHVGQKVTVLYNPSNPTEAQLYDFTEMWGPTLLFVINGAFLIGLSFIMKKKINIRNRKTKL